MAGLFRSLLFVPGNNPRFLEKAKTIQADIICFDLEDSVPDTEKENARKLIKKALNSRSEYASSVYVRTNAPSSGKIPDDLEQIVQKGLDGIVIPKVDSAKDVLKIKKMLANLEKKRKIDQLAIIPSIESSLGVVNTYEIASSSKRVAAVIFGVFDLLNDMGIEYKKQAEGAKYARAKIPLDARAAGVYAIDAIWQDLQDKDGLLQDCITGKSLGYVGKSIIHPDQIPVAHGAFAPNKAELEWANKVCQAYVESTKKGRGATVVDGKMIDEVHYKQARALLDIAKIN
ncbi:HpcH/HpaI aldolase/citrate lyase family protein [Candidatus Nitrosotenuis uzonensis]|uniref:Citryl-CoA lyase n=1 Tax=Candidatus Nitrosotenuis uzonensis TaxID=1407055 RepID=V6AQY6_9ARCH|nr:CoA ester lyase [Candidatus Nitrosotenuis uzonensis]CDI04965.1 Citryl-CoA lyase [Candidatus Nitrosotenuis uzonensis]